MDLEQIVTAVTNLYNDYQIFCIIALIGLGISLYQNPKSTLKYLALLLSLLLAGYFVLQMGNSTDQATSNTKELGQKSKKAFGD